MREKRVKISLTDFECNLLINGINEWRNIIQTLSISILKTLNST